MSGASVIALPETADMVVIGSGAAGMTAATVGALNGLDVVLLEAADVFGGTTAFSGGGVWIPANHHQPALSIADDRASARTYLEAVLGNFFNAAKIDTYLDKSGEMLAFMESRTTVRLTPSDIPDYAPSAAGWNQGRCLLTADFDGNALGADFERVRPPIREMGLFKSMQVSPAQAVAMQGWNRSLSAFRLTASRMTGYAFDRLRGRRGRHMANGNALAGRLFKSARDAGVHLIEKARACDLVFDGGQVTGVVFEHGGGRHTVKTRQGVVLASGGFGQDEAMRQKWLHQSAVLVAPARRQPGRRHPHGREAGRAAEPGQCGERHLGAGLALSAGRRQRRPFPSLFFDRHCPGQIMVDARDGKRFVDESFHYQNFGEVSLEKGVTRIWQIADAEAVARYGLGAIKPAPFRPDKWVASGYARKAASISELARELGLDPLALSDTVERFNRHAADGRDPDFGRGTNAYDTYMGDAGHGPNPSLRPLTKAPFYAIEVRPSDLGSIQGLDTDEHARVLGADGAPIAGLYAAGLDNNSIMRGKYPGGGASLGPAMTFGYIAALDIAARAASKGRDHV
ncbi:FAD-dependent oxidoreductase [Novosphingobium resinovorum]